MTKNGIILKCGILSLMMCGGTWAQSSTAGSDSKPVLPPGPLVNHIPKPGSWSVTYSYPQEKSQQGQDVLASIAGNIRNLTTESAGNLTHVMLTSIGGQVHSMWKSGSNMYGQSAVNAPWTQGVVDPLTGGPVHDEFLDGTDFPGLKWLKASYFIGFIKYQNVDCLLFAVTDKLGVDSNDPAAVDDLMQHATNLAVIDLKSRYPLEVTSSGIKEIFEYRSPPSSLSLPQDLANQIAQGQQVRDRMNQRAPRP